MSRPRLIVLLVSAPIIVLMVVGGFMGKAFARQDGYQPLRVFEDVVSLIVNNYVERVETDKVMRGAMQGLAEGLDPESAYLTPAQVTAITSNAPEPQGELGIELTRQYYLRVLAVKDGSPADRAGLQTGDYIRAIDGKPTRDLSVLMGSRLLRGAPGSAVELTVIRGNAAEPHTLTVTREAPAHPQVSGRIVRDGIGLVRVPAWRDGVAAKIRQQVAALQKAGATHVLIDLRSSAEGTLEQGLEAAGQFVDGGLLALRETRDNKLPIEARTGAPAITVPLTLLVDTGTAGPAELFAAALAARGRATLVGERTAGRAATQELVRLPDGSGLWLSTARYLTPKEAPIHEKGLTPDVPVDAPVQEFGADAPATDPILEKALERAAEKRAA